MDNQFADLSQAEVDRLYQAASAVFFAVVDFESGLQGGPLLLPAWFCPSQEPPCPCSMDPELIREASMFLVRMGILWVDGLGQLRVS